MSINAYLFGMCGFIRNKIPSVALKYRNEKTDIAEIHVHWNEAYALRSANPKLGECVIYEVGCSHSNIHNLAGQLSVLHIIDAILDKFHLGKSSKLSWETVRTPQFIDISWAGHEISVFFRSLRPLVSKFFRDWLIYPVPKVHIKANKKSGLLVG